MQNFLKVHAGKQRKYVNMDNNISKSFRPQKKTTKNKSHSKEPVEDL